MEVKVSVLQHARAKYACRHCEHHGVRTPIVVAPMPAQPLPGSHASASMTAAVTAGKYVDGTPLYRTEDVLARSNIAVSRGTLANWIIHPAELHYRRIYDALKQILRSQWLIHGDETTVQVLADGAHVHPEQLGHQLLRQPPGFVLVAGLDALPACLACENQELVGAVADQFCAAYDSRSFLWAPAKRSYTWLPSHLDTKFCISGLPM